MGGNIVDEHAGYYALLQFERHRFYVSEILGRFLADSHPNLNSRL